MKKPADRLRRTPPPDVDATSAELPQRGAGGLMLDAHFASFFWARLISQVGFWLQNIVAALLIYELTESAMLVGLVSAVQFVPQVLTPLAGRWSDRGGACSQVVMGRVLNIVGPAFTAAWLTLAPDASVRSITWAVLIGCAITGFGFVVGGPAMQTVVHGLIRPGELTAAMSLNTVPQTAARVIGPAAGAAAYLYLGTATALWLAAVLHFPLIWAAILVRYAWDHEDGGETEDGTVRAALRYVVRDRPILFVLIGISMVGIATEPATTLAPSVAVQLGADLSFAGVLTTVTGIGAMLGVIMVWTVGRRGSAVMFAWWGLMAMAVGLAGSSVTPSVSYVMVMFALMGAGFSVTVTGFSTLLQSRAPTAMRNRVVALWFVGFIGGRPIAATAAGGLADLLSVHVSFLVFGVVTAAAAFVCRPSAIRGAAVQARIE